MVALHPPKQQRTRTVRAIWESLQESEKPECALEGLHANMTRSQKAGKRPPLPKFLIPNL